MSDVHWLDEVVTAAAEGGPLLVVCRTQATLRAVLRRLTETAFEGRGGWTGLRISTLSGLAAQAATGRLAPEPLEDAALPASHPWRAKLDERPGLRRMLRARLARLHEAVLAGGSLEGTRAEIRALVQEGYGEPEALEGARALLASPLPPRCIAVGFGEDAAPLLSVSPLDRALLRALGARHLAAGTPLAGFPRPIPALRLPDMAAEARAVAREVLVRRPMRALVLVPDEETEERVHAALRRNGVAVADDGSAPLTRHALVAAVEPLVVVFGSRGEEPVEATDLVRLLTDAVLARTPAGDVEPVPGVEALRAATRHVRDILLSCRRARATTAEWVAAVAGVEREAAAKLAALPEDERTTAAWFLASARVLLSQLRALDARARSGGRLGDLHAFLCTVGLSDPLGDRLGQAILHALRSEGHRPAHAEHYLDTLSGSLSSGRVDAGVVTLPYSAYDGRDADLVLLTGVHDKGLGRIPAPDPILNEAELRAAGLPAPEAARRERLALARWAVSRARTALALVAETDASGRRVSPPIDLELALDPRDADRSYGLGFDLPEARDREALAAGRGEQDPAARQVDAEWARRGAAFDEATAAPAEPGETLADQVPLDLARIPAELLPWLGAAGSHPSSGDGLPPGLTLSASRLEPFTQCLYRAFCQSVLRLDVPDEVTEDLDPREVGTAVHSALQEVLEGKKLLVPERKLEAVRADVLDGLRKATARAVEEEAAKRPSGADAATLRLARKGLSDRWLRHWEVYVPARIESVEAAEEKLRKRVLKVFRGGEILSSAVEALAGGFSAKAPREQVEKALFAIAGEERGNLDAVLARGEEIVGAVAGKNRPEVQRRLGLKKTRPALAALCQAIAEALRGRGYDPRGDLEVVAAEHVFGAMRDGDGKGEPLLLRLGRAPIPVRGRIDAVLRRRGAGDLAGTAYRVTDFKSGGKNVTPDEITEELIRPQLPLYALALEAQGPLARGHATPARVEQGELDHVKAAERTSAELGPEAIQRIRAALGALLDHARDGTWLAAPHPRGCPMLRERGIYCDHAEVCRVRSKYEPAEREEATP